LYAAKPFFITEKTLLLLSTHFSGAERSRRGTRTSHVAHPEAVHPETIVVVRIDSSSGVPQAASIEKEVTLNEVNFELRGRLRFILLRISSFGDGSLIISRHPSSAMSRIRRYHRVLTDGEPELRRRGRRYERKTAMEHYAVLGCATKAIGRTIGWKKGSAY
jgi:hypothetical protein